MTALIHGIMSQRWRRAALRCLLSVVCVSCAPTENTPAPLDPPKDAPVGTDAIGDVSADLSTDRSADTSMDSSGDASTDRSADASMDSSPDASADVTADLSADARDAAFDRSVDDADGEATDSVTLDAVTPDQITTPDGPDADAKPRAPTCTVDQPCVNGDCIGSSCDEIWECFGHLAAHPCPFETIPYCGCDGKTYFFPITCPEVPYEHAGACGDGVNCDPSDVRCKQPEPDCGPGRVASVVAGCYGPCVPITQCRCVLAFECPKRDLYTCTPDLHCDFEMK